jgi:signal transduction histidine kinase
MSEWVLGVICGALAAIVGVLLAVLLASRSRGDAEHAAMRRALSASGLWWWRCDEQSRICSVTAGRCRPVWLETEAMLGLPFWQLPGTEPSPPPAALSEPLAARLPFYDVPVRSAAAQATVWMSAEPCFDGKGRFCGYAGVARPAGGAMSAPGDAAPQDPGGEASARARIAELEHEQAERARQFELTARELESFAYSVSHDLRAPLRVIEGFAGILLEDYAPRLDDLGRDHLRRIVGAAGRMNAMIDALLSLSRRTARELCIEHVDLSRAAREVAEELQASDFGRHAEFRIEPGLTADGDPVLLRLVLQNLLGNAFKFTAQAPQARIEFGREQAEEGPAFYVRDNGAGFDMRFAERLFGLFQRLHSQNDFPGTGVGLATVQRVVRKHGGRVWARGEPGKGACFYFTLPARAS